MRPRVLIVAYGNSLRSDDGVAWRVAAALQGKFPEDEVEIQCLLQLGPEVAESVRRSECVIFVDAATVQHPGQIEIKALLGEAKSTRTPAFAHALNPVAVVNLAAQLYHAHPRAFSATITAQTFEHGESLSPVIAAALPELVARLEAKVREFLKL